MPMTPKEKAVEMYNKCLLYINTENRTDLRIGAKGCCGIWVQEILKEIPMYTGNINPKWEFWNNVKEELQNL